MSNWPILRHLRRSVACLGGSLLSACAGGGDSTPTPPPPVTVTPPVISSFSASAATILTGTTVALSWTVTGAATLTLDQGIGSVIGSTSTNVKPVATTTYTLSASSSAGTVTRSATVTLATVNITLDATLSATQVFHFGQADAMGLFNVPDMHLAALRQTNGSYLLWITGNIGASGGSVTRLSTSDFLLYQYAGPSATPPPLPVMAPSCDGVTPACLANIDADYVGANTVVRAANGSDLLMFYEAGNKTIGSVAQTGWEYNETSVARSTDNGLTWIKTGPGAGPILSGSDAKPTTSVGTTQPGISEPGAIAVNGYLYMFFQYVPNKTSEPEAPSVIQAARASVGSDGAPGSWMKYYNGGWTEPGLGGQGTTIVPTGTIATRPVEVWPVYSSYLNAYVLLFLANEGWFFTTSTDLVTWSAPKNFMPMVMWQNCQPMSWNYVFVTPGSDPGTIGQTGYVLYAHTDQKGLGCGSFAPHELWVRSFTFVKTP